MSAYTHVTCGFRCLLVEKGSASFSSCFLSSLTSECWWNPSVCLPRATSTPDRTEVGWLRPLKGLPGLLDLTEHLLTWFEAPVECLDLLRTLDVVSQPEAGITLAVGCCGLLGGSGFPLWSDEGEVQSGLNRDYKKKKHIIRSSHLNLMPVHSRLLKQLTEAWSVILGVVTSSSHQLGTSGKRPSLSAAVQREQVKTAQAGQWPLPRRQCTHPLCILQTCRRTQS